MRCADHSPIECRRVPDVAESLKRSSHTARTKSINIVTRSMPKALIRGRSDTIFLNVHVRGTLSYVLCGRNILFG